MDQVCFALPVISGKTEDARAFFKELEGSRKAEFARSEERIGIPKETWYLQQTPTGDLLIGYMESPDFARALDLFARSQDEFDAHPVGQVLAGAPILVVVAIGSDPTVSRLTAPDATIRA